MIIVQDHNRTRLWHRVWHVTPDLSHPPRISSFLLWTAAVRISFYSWLSDKPQLSRICTIASLHRFFHVWGSSTVDHPGASDSRNISLDLGLRFDLCLQSYTHQRFTPTSLATIPLLTGTRWLLHPRLTPLRTYVRILYSVHSYLCVNLPSP